MSLSLFSHDFLCSNKDTENRCQDRLLADGNEQRQQRRQRLAQLMAAKGYIQALPADVNTIILEDDSPTKLPKRNITKKLYGKSKRSIDETFHLHPAQSLMASKNLKEIAVKLVKWILQYYQDNRRTPLSTDGDDAVRFMDPDMDLMEGVWSNDESKCLLLLPFLVLSGYAQALADMSGFSRYESLKTYAKSGMTLRISDKDTISGAYMECPGGYYVSFFIMPGITKGKQACFFLEGGLSDLQERSCDGLLFPTKQWQNYYKTQTSNPSKKSDDAGEKSDTDKKGGKEDSGNSSFTSQAETSNTDRRIKDLFTTKPDQAYANIWEVAVQDLIMQHENKLSLVAAVKTWIAMQWGEGNNTFHVISPPFNIQNMISKAQDISLLIDALPGILLNLLDHARILAQAKTSNDGDDADKVQYNFDNFNVVCKRKDVATGSTYFSAYFPTLDGFYISLYMLLIQGGFIRIAMRYEEKQAFGKDTSKNYKEKLAKQNPEILFPFEESEIGIAQSRNDIRLEIKSDQHPTFFLQDSSPNKCNSLKAAKRKRNRKAQRGLNASKANSIPKRQEDTPTHIFM
jgi:hypothetical protein